MYVYINNKLRYKFSKISKCHFFTRINWNFDTGKKEKSIDRFYDSINWFPKILINLRTINVFYVCVHLIFNEN